VSRPPVEFFANLVGAAADPAAWARQREAEGWHGLGVADHIWAGTTTFTHWAVALGQMAAVTERVQLISCFANNLLRSPVEFAQAALALQRASSGRFEAGLGAGWAREEVEGLGMTFPAAGVRVDRYAEAVEVVRRLLRDGRCRYEGAHHRIDVAAIGPAVDAPPPLVLALGGERTIRELGPLADRIELTFNAAATRGGAIDRSRMSELGREHLADLVARAGELPGEIPLGIFLTVACGDDDVTMRLRDSGALGIDGLAGAPEAVAEVVLGLIGPRVSRVQLTPATPTTLRSIAPHLPLHP